MKSFRCSIEVVDYQNISSIHTPKVQISTFQRHQPFPLFIPSFDSLSSMFRMQLHLQLLLVFQLAQRKFIKRVLHYPNHLPLTNSSLNTKTIIILVEKSNIKHYESNIVLFNTVQLFYVGSLPSVFSTLKIIAIIIT